MSLGTRTGIKATSAVRRARGLLCLLGVLASLGVAHAWTSVVTVDDQDGLYHVKGSFITGAPPRIAWNVLTDYDEIDSFVRSLQDSEVLSRDSSGVRVRQSASMRFFLVRRTIAVELDIEEQSPSRISFQDVLDDDFRVYRGEWNVLEDSTGTTVLYSLRARLRAAVPHTIVRRVLSGDVREMLEDVEKEMERRAAVAGELPQLRPARIDVAGPDSTSSIY